MLEQKLNEDPEINDDGNYLTDWQTWAFLILTLAIIGCAAKILFLSWELTRVAALVALVQTTNAVNQSRPLFLKYEKEPAGKIVTEPEQQVMERQDWISNNLTEIIKWEWDIDVTRHYQAFQILLFLLAFSMFGGLAYKFIQKRRNAYQNFSTVIWYNISNGKDLISVKSQSLPDVINHFIFKSSNNIEDVRVIFGWHPVLKIIWDLRIKHRFADRDIEFESVSHLSWYQFWKLRRIIQDKGFMIIPYLQITKDQFAPLIVKGKNIVKNMNRDAEIQFRAEPSAPVPSMYPKLEDA